MNEIISSVLPVLGTGICIVSAGAIIGTGYIKAPPDTAYIISGLRKRTVIGGAAIKIPFLDRCDKLYLGIMPIDVKTKSHVPTADYINILVDGIANVKVSTDPELLELAAQNFLNKNTDYIISVVQEILEGNMREIVGKMYLKDMVSDRQKFANEVKDNVVPDLRNMGLELVNFNVQNFKDENGLIEDLGIDNISQIRKKAAIARAEAEKEIAQAQADANKEKAIAQARAESAANAVSVQSKTEIAERENQLAIRAAQLQKDADRERAIAEASGDIETQVQFKQITEAEAEAKLARQEKEIELRKKAVAIQEQELEATVKKQADADRYAAQQRAEADLFTRQKEAEARKYETIQEAEARKAEADANRYVAEQEAEGTRMRGQAEADAIRAKKEAEADGMLKLAEAQQKMGNASILDMWFKAMPDVARAVAEPLSAIDSITMYGEGNTAKLTEDITNTINQVVNALHESTGFDARKLIQSFVEK